MKMSFTLFFRLVFRFELVEAGAGAPFLLDGKMEQSWLVGPEVVRRVMADAKEQGLDFIRFNAFAVDSQYVFSF